MAAVDPPTAARLIGERLTCLPIESLPVAHCVGAVLRENVYAERDQPPFAVSEMDGYAVIAADTPGTLTLMPANVPHAVDAQAASRMLLLMLR